MFNAFTGDADLLHEIVVEPTTPNVYSGHHPTYLMAPQIPHDGFLTDFLVRNKGFIRD